MSALEELGWTGRSHIPAGSGELRVEGPSEGLITGEDSVLPFDLKSEDIPMEARYAQQLSTGAS